MANAEEKPTTRSSRPPAALDLSLEELAGELGAELLGDGTVRIAGVGGLEDSGPGDLVRVDAPRFLAAALASPAAALLVGPDMAAEGRPVLRVRDPRLAFARALELFYPERRPPAGVDRTARLGPGVTMGEGCSIGAYAVLGARVSLGEGVVIHPLVYLGDDVQVGEGSVLFPHVTVYERVRIGRRARIHSGAVIGADGFGFTVEAGMPRKIPQVGSVVIEDDVEIGANSGVDRATTGETQVGAGTKIDNMVQVGHNVKIGRGCRIMALCGIAGSSRIEDGAMIAGMVGVSDHVRVGQGAIVGAQSSVWTEVPDGAVYSGQPARPHRERLRSQAAAARYEKTMDQVRELDRRLRELEARLGSK